MHKPNKTLIPSPTRPSRRGSLPELGNIEKLIEEIREFRLELTRLETFLKKAKRKCAALEQKAEKQKKKLIEAELKLSLNLKNSNAVVRFPGERRRCKSCNEWDKPDDRSPFLTAKIKKAPKQPALSPRRTLAYLPRISRASRCVDAERGTRSGLAPTAVA